MGIANCHDGKHDGAGLEHPPRRQGLGTHFQWRTGRVQWRNVSYRPVDLYKLLEINRFQYRNVRQVPKVLIIVQTITHHEFIRDLEPEKIGQQRDFLSALFP